MLLDRIVNGSPLSLRRSDLRTNVGEGRTWAEVRLEDRRAGQVQLITGKRFQ